MSRFDDALACLRSGGAVLLIDEREASADLVAASSVATPKALSDLVDRGQGPLVLVKSNRAAAPADGSSAPDGPVAALPAALAKIEVATVSVDPHGVLAHPGTAEGAADLLRLADIGSAALLRAAALPGSVLTPSGTMERVAER